MCDCWVIEYGAERCMGTKETECCYCHGDMAKCTFYPEKRKEAKTMNTAEMWLAAQKNGKTYANGDVQYSARDGMSIDSMFMPYVCFGDIMAMEWCEVEIPTISRKEAEEKLGAKIVD